MQSFPLRPARSAAHKWLQLGAVLLLIFAILFWLIPDPSTMWSVYAAAVIVLAGMAHFADRRKQIRIELTDQLLSVRGDIFGKKWPLSNFAIDQARFVNLHTERAMRPQWKIFGTSMGGYHAGEFRLRNKKLATVFLSDEDSVLIIPFHSGALLMLSVGPDFLEALQSTRSTE